jgi:hypothetical protein
LIQALSLIMGDVTRDGTPIGVGDSAGSRNKLVGLLELKLQMSHKAQRGRS